MTQDDIVEMARQAGMDYIQHITEDNMKKIEDFVKLVDAKATAKEREACALICDNLDDSLPDGLAGWQYGEAIRARRDEVTYGEPTLRGEA